MTMRSAALLIGATVAMCLSPAVFAEDSFFSWLVSFSRQKEIAPVTDTRYNKECGSCHFPYQPGLLPTASWNKLMEPTALSNHFGDNAELDEETRKHILAIMTADAADTSYRKRSRKIMASLDDGAVPSRIIEVPYIKTKHSEIPENQIKGNPQVKSLSFCNKCHQKAADGIFDDDTVLIPGQAR